MKVTRIMSLVGWGWRLPADDQGWDGTLTYRRVSIAPFSAWSGAFYSILPVELVRDVEGSVDKVDRSCLIKAQREALITNFSDRVRLSSALVAAKLKSSRERSEVDKEGEK